MADPTYPLFPIFSFLGFFLALLPLPWHLKAWNSGTCFFMMWASLSCLNQFINSLVWHNNAINWIPIWCEISIRIIMGASVGIPASSLCISRRLYHIITNKSATITQKSKTRAVLVDALICVVFPLIYVALQYIVQGHRFNIFEDIGCLPALYNTLPTYFISSMWPLLIGVISAVYCILTLRVFVLRRIEFASIIASHPSVTVSRYFRLMALAGTELILTIPLCAIIIWLNATTMPIEPWISWEDTHFDFSRIEQVPAILWKNNHLVAAVMEFNRWLVPVPALVFFAFFGFAEEARKHYVSCFEAICNILPNRVRFMTRYPHTIRPLRLSSKDFCDSSTTLPPPVTSKHKGLHVNVSVESIFTKDTGSPLTANPMYYTLASSQSSRFPVPMAHENFVQYHEPPLPPAYIPPTIHVPNLSRSSDTASIRTCPW